MTIITAPTWPTSAHPLARSYRCEHCETEWHSVDRACPWCGVDGVLGALSSLNNPYRPAERLIDR